MKHTKGPWRIQLANETTINGIKSVRYAIVDDVGREIARTSGLFNTACEKDHAERLASTPTAPHDCDDPNGLGAVNKRRLEAAGEMATALNYLRDQDDNPQSVTTLSNYAVRVINEALSAWEKAGKGE